MLLIAPFGFEVFHQYVAMPYRVTTLLFPLGIVSVLSIALAVSRKFCYLRVIIICILVLISIQYLWLLNQNTYLNYMQNKRDIATVYMLQSRINSIPAFAERAAREEKIPVLLVGNNKYSHILSRPQMQQPYPYWHSEIIGLSCLDSPIRFVMMMNIFCYPNYTVAPLTMDKVPFIEKMPMWPLDGSVAFYQNCLIVKFSDLPASLSNMLHRKASVRNPYPINGAEELSFVKTKGMRLVHSYTASNLVYPTVKKKEKSLLINPENTGRTIVFQGKRIDTPYVILEITADYDKDGTFCLWSDQEKQIMEFMFKAGKNHLMVRCPSYFLNKKFQIAMGQVNRVSLEDIKVFEDMEYTKNAIPLGTKKIFLLNNDTNKECPNEAVYKKTIYRLCLCVLAVLVLIITKLL